MVILGIDPGYERMGFGCILKTGSTLRHLASGTIQTPRIELAERLRVIHAEIERLIAEHSPDVLAVEKLIFAANKTTAFDVAKAVGVVLLAASERGIEVSEFSPPEVKQSVVGFGAAEKKQVQFMVAKLLGLKEAPKPDDAADALAVAICCSFKRPLTRPLASRERG